MYTGVGEIPTPPPLFFFNVFYSSLISLFEGGDINICITLDSWSKRRQTSSLTDFVTLQAFCLDKSKQINSLKPLLNMGKRTMGTTYNQIIIIISELDDYIDQFLDLPQQLCSLVQLPWLVTLLFGTCSHVSTHTCTSTAVCRLNTFHIDFLQI